MVQQSLLDNEAGDKSEGGGKERFQVRLKDGSVYGEAISALQKMIRRGMVKEAVTVAYTIYDSNFGKALAIRLSVIAAEDIGLANPALVAEVHAICSAWIAMNKEKDRMPVNALIYCTYALAASPKNQNAANAMVWAWQMHERGEYTAKHVIEENADVICDVHTDRGRKKLADKVGWKNVKSAGMKQFYENTGRHRNYVEVDGEQFTKTVCDMFGTTYDQFRGLDRK